MWLKSTSLLLIASILVFFFGFCESSHSQVVKQNQKSKSKSKNNIGYANTSTNANLSTTSGVAIGSNGNEVTDVSVGMNAKGHVVVCWTMSNGMPYFASGQFDFETGKVERKHIILQYPKVYINIIKIRYLIHIHAQKHPFKHAKTYHILK